jgi:hypothetical protein
MNEPSNFTKFPCDSIKQNHQTEQIARNIMVILKRTGDTFRLLTWKEYKKERLEDGHFTESEHRYFDDVIAYCASPETAKKFSPVWKTSYTQPEINHG